MGIAIALAAWFMTPALACLLPNRQLTQEEHACCKQMAKQCGSMRMASSHKCCQAEVRVPNAFLKASGTVLHTAEHSSFVITQIPQIKPATEFNLHVGSSIHSPPESPPSSTTILRI
jgi:hypothetical protein